jgi:hypothetical protein
MKKPIRQTLFEELDLSLSAFGDKSKKISIDFLKKGGIKYRPDDIDIEKTIDILADIFGSYMDIMLNRMYWNTCSKLDIDPDRSVNVAPRQKILDILKAPT